MSSIMTDERGVSETLGYIMIFGVVVAGIAMVFLIGSHIIANTQESASFQGLEQSFEVVSSDLRSTAFEESPMMTTRVKIDYGSISLLPEGISGNEVVIYGNDSADMKYSQPIGVLKFVSQTYGKSITLEDGALAKMYDGDGAYGSSMTLEPRIFFSDSTNTLLVTVINLKGAYTGYSGGIDNIQTSYLDSTLEQYTGLSSAMLCIRTNYTGAWANYFTDYFIERKNDVSMTFDTTGDTGNWTNVTFPNVNKMVVLTYDIGVQI
jgi:hypothetical protein